MTDDRWRIESKFRDGTDRVRRSNGQYESVSNAILDEVSEFEVFSESEVATRLGLDETVVLEHLYHLRDHGLVDGIEGSWTRDFDRSTLSGPDDEYIF